MCACKWPAISLKDCNERYRPDACAVIHSGCYRVTKKTKTKTKKTTANECVARVTREAGKEKRDGKREDAQNLAKNNGRILVVFIITFPGVKVKKN